MLGIVCRVAERWQRRKHFDHIRREFARSGFPVDHVDDVTIEAVLTRNGSCPIEEVPLTGKMLYLAQRRITAGTKSGR